MSRVSAHDLRSCCCLPIVWRASNTCGRAVNRHSGSPGGAALSRSTTYSRIALATSGGFHAAILFVRHYLRLPLLFRLLHRRTSRSERRVADRPDRRLATQRHYPAKYWFPCRDDFHAHPVERDWNRNLAAQEICYQTSLDRSSRGRDRHSREGVCSY